MLFPILSLVTAYLLGSIPTAYIVTMIKKNVDIRNIDVGNVGASAAYRQAGLLAGTIVAVVDIGKGAAAVAIAHFGFQVSDLWVLASALAVFLGHCFPIYIGFRGGQGTATVIGIFSVLTPHVMAIIILLLAITLFFVRRVFPSIIIVSPLLPTLVWFLTGSTSILILTILIMSIMIYRNRHGIVVEANKVRNKINLPNKTNKR